MRTIAVKQNLAVVFSTLVILAAMAAACGGTSAYKTFTFDHRTKPNAQDHPVEQVTHFSFEYPGGYRKSGTYARDDPNAPVSVRFVRATGTLGCTRLNDTVFGINIGLGFSGYRNAAEAASRAVSALGDGGLVRERSVATVAGLTGVQVVYHDPRMPGTPEVRTVFFDYGGRTWDVFIYSESAGAEQARLDFEHIVQTFSIPP